jgi:hypothetical protein
VKVHEVRRAIATAPDNADVFVDEDSIRFVSETEPAPPPTASYPHHEAPTLAPPPTFDSTVCIDEPPVEPFFTPLPESIPKPAAVPAFEPSPVLGRGHFRTYK